MGDQQIFVSSSLSFVHSERTIRVHILLALQRRMAFVAGVLSDGSPADRSRCIVPAGSAVPDHTDLKVPKWTAHADG